MVERIMFDDAFYKEVMEGICHIFTYGMLLEIIGKWFTRRPVADSSGIITTPILSSAQAMKTLKTSKVWYYCSQPNYSTMRIRGPPKGKWYFHPVTNYDNRTRKKETGRLSNNVFTLKIKTKTK